MNRQKTLIAVVFFLLTGATAGLILHASANQRLGDPGVRTRPLPDSRNLQVVLPEHVPGYTSFVTNQADIVVTSLPDDTSFGKCLYTAKDGFQTCANVVLMGTDRSSIHKPQVCLTAQGWKIDDSASKVETIRMTRPFAYDLPVMRLTGTVQVQENGQDRTVRGVYVYWFVDGTKLTAEHWQRMWWMARDLLQTGVLDRFAYVAYLSFCEPGQEDATFQRMKTIITDTVPEFQLVPRNPGAAAAIRP
jgi:hypothetical protein